MKESKLKYFLEFLRWFFTLSPKSDGLVLLWNFLPNSKWSDGTRLRYWGFQYTWYDGPLYSFGFWFYHFVIQPSEQDLLHTYYYRQALEEVVKMNAQVHLLSENELIRKAAQDYIRSKKNEKES